MARYRRKRIYGRKNRRMFTRVARRVHKKNLTRVISRGGIRL